MGHARLRKAKRLPSRGLFSLGPPQNVRKKGLERTCKPGSVPVDLRRRAMAISLGCRLLDLSSGLPGSRQRAGPARGTARRTFRHVEVHCSLFDLAPGGVCLAKLVTQPAGELLPHRFTLTVRNPQNKGAVRRFTFCCTFPGLTAGGRYPSPCPAEPGLSSRRVRRRSIWRPRELGRRPSGPLQTFVHYISSACRWKRPCQLSRRISSSAMALRSPCLSRHHIGPAR